MDNKIEILEEELEDAAALLNEPHPETDAVDENSTSETHAMDASFMSESIYEKLPPPSPKSKRPRAISMLTDGDHLALRTANSPRTKIYANSTRAFRTGIYDKGASSS